MIQGAAHFPLAFVFHSASICKTGPFFDLGAISIRDLERC